MNLTIFQEFVRQNVNVTSETTEIKCISDSVLKQPNLKNYKHLCSLPITDNLILS